MAQSIHVKLLAHPTNPARFHERIDAGIEQLPDGGLQIAYAIHGLNIDLRIPGPHAPAPHDALWQTTCCELFLGPTEQASYREFNFSPSGQWASYDFIDTRQPRPQPVSLAAPRIDFARSEDLMTLTVALPPTSLPEAQSLRIAISVILQANDSNYAYWALAHPAAKPDFHHPAGFVLRHDARGFHA
jgi:hypothetical protein